MIKFVFLHTFKMRCFDLASCPPTDKGLIQVQTACISIVVLNLALFARFSDNSFSNPVKTFRKYDAKYTILHCKGQIA